jgi:peptidoglycan L-alanyl-D-glutamate endopeptidase CwlK
MIPYAQAFVAAMNAQGIPFCITSTIRTTAEQKALYAQGRKSLAEVNALRVMAGYAPLATQAENGIVTQCDGLTTLSNHQGGMAMDIVPLDAAGKAIWDGKNPAWQKCAACGEAVGLEWGGRWKDFPEYPHFQLRKK